MHKTKGPLVIRAFLAASAILLFEGASHSALLAQLDKQGASQLISAATHCLDEATNEPRLRVNSLEGGDVSTATGDSNLKLNETAGASSSGNSAASGTQQFTRPPTSPAGLPMC